MPTADDLDRIEAALDAALEALAPFSPGNVAFQHKGGGDPVTEADTTVNRRLHELLPLRGDGWLSEETRDDPGRVERRRVWVVDPLDGTREFVQGIPEWCVSIGLVEDGRPVAGGVCNPATGDRVVGGAGAGVRHNGDPVRLSPRTELEGATVLASRSEVGRGEWERFSGAPFTVRAMGSVAYKLALVAAGQADATWTLVPKNEWDVAAGAALVLAAGGEVGTTDAAPLEFNRRDPRLPGFLATRPGLSGQVRELLGL